MSTVGTDPQFGRLRAVLTAPAQATVIDEVADVCAALERARAYHAAKRMRQLDDYATVLPPESLPPFVDSTSALDELEDVKGKGLGWSTLLRNVLALVPLLFTWFSLYKATGAYHDEIRQRPNEVYQPFLILWQNGFGSHFWLTFSTVAGIDTGLFLLIIVFTGLIHFQERDAQRAARRLVARMEHAVTAIAAALGQERLTATSNPGDWAAAVQRVIDRAMNETRQLNLANQQALQAAQEAIRSAEQRHRDLVHELGREIVTTLGAMRSENEHMIKGMATEARDMFAQASAAHQQLAQSSLEAIDKAREAMEHVANEAHRADERSDERAREFMGQFRQESIQAFQALHDKDREFLVHMTQEGRDLLLAAGDRADELTRKHLMPAMESFQRMIEGFRADLGQYQQGAKALVESTAKVEDAAGRLSASAQAFSVAAQSIDTNIKGMAHAQEQFADRVASATTAMREAATQVHDTTTQASGLLRSIAEDVSPQLREMGSQVNVASTLLATTQSRLAQASEGLVGAIEYFRKMPRPKVVLALIGRHS